jgi:lipoprotein NlpI
MSQFVLGDFARAQADLATGLRLDPDSVHGRVLWYLAVSRAGGDGNQSLRRFRAANPTDAWPFPVVALLLEEISPAACLAAAEVGDPDQAQGNLCEAHFYVAQYHLLHGDEEQAAAHFEKCLAMGREEFNEYRIARAELARLTSRATGSRD